MEYASPPADEALPKSTSSPELRVVAKKMERQDARPVDEVVRADMDIEDVRPGQLSLMSSVRSVAVHHLDFELFVRLGLGPDELDVL